MQSIPRKVMRLSVVFLVMISISTIVYSQANDSSQLDSTLLLQSIKSDNSKSAIDSLKYYQLEKLKEEITDLKQNKPLSPTLRIIPTIGGLVTAFIAVLGAIFSFWRYLSGRRLENKLRLEEKFNSIMENLGSDSPSVQASAAVATMTFLKPEYKEFHTQIYLILLANLKTDHTEAVNSILVKAFEKALRLRLEEIGDDGFQEGSMEADLSKANLYRIDLSGLNLTGFDFAFSKLKNANLENCTLVRIKGYRTDLSNARLSDTDLSEARLNEAICISTKFHNSELVSIKLKKAILRKAEFLQTRLQEAHLQGSDLRGTRFAQANLKNTFFQNTICDDGTLKNLLKAKNSTWRNANFDQDVKDNLERLSQR